MCCVTRLICAVTVSRVVYWSRETHVFVVQGEGVEGEMEDVDFQNSAVEVEVINANVWEGLR